MKLKVTVAVIYALVAALETVMAVHSFVADTGLGWFYTIIAAIWAVLTWAWVRNVLAARSDKIKSDAWREQWHEYEQYRDTRHTK